MSELKDKVLNSFKWNSIYTVIQTLMNPLVLVILARYLTPTEFGFYSIVTILIGISKNLAKLGFSQAIIKEDNIEDGDLSSIFWFEQILGFLMFILIILLAPFIAIFFNEPGIINLIRLSAFAFLLEPIDLVFRALLEKKMEYGLLQGSNLVRIFSISISKIIFAILGFGAYSIVIGNLIGIVVLTIILSYIFYSKKIWFPKFYFSFSNVKPYLKFGIFISAKSIVHTMSKRFDEVIIGRVVGSEGLGIYYFAKNIMTQLYTLLSNPISRVSFPLLSKFKKNKIRFNQIYLKVTSYLSVLGFPAIVGFAVISPMTIPLFFGQEWVEAIPYIYILSGWALVKIIEKNMPSRALYCYDRSDLVFYITMGDFVFRSLIMYIFVQHSLELMAISYSIVEAIKYIVWISFLNNETGIILKNIGKNIYQYAIYSFIMMFGVLLTINLGVDIIFNIIISVLIGVLIYGLLIIIFSRKMIKEVFDLVYNR